MILEQIVPLFACFYEKHFFQNEYLPAPCTEQVTGERSGKIGLILIHQIRSPRNILMLSCPTKNIIVLFPKDPYFTSHFDHEFNMLKNRGNLLWVGL